jgi:GntR family transcriptional regulator/MocR family aminotransferase
VETREGAGTSVSPAAPEPPRLSPRSNSGNRAAPAPRTVPAPRVAPARAKPAPNRDFELEGIDPDLFPAAAWRRLMTRHMRSSRFNLTRTGDPQGTMALRETLCRFLGATRGMTVDPGQIVIVNGIQQAMLAVAQMLVHAGTPLITEAPGCSLIAPLYERYGARDIPVPVDAEGLLTGHLPEERDGIAVVTPARQFPFGGTLPAARRQALLDWAERTNAHVFEIDFDSDFRYEGSPLPSLQAMDRHGRFIYAGAFTMTIGPGLRIGYLVLPRRLVDPTLAAIALLDHAWPIQGQGASWLEQAVLADFIASGGYDTHLRRLRKAYMARRDQIAAGLSDLFGPADLLGIASGTHFVWRLPAHLPGAEACAARAAAAGITVYTLKLKTIAGAETWPDWDRYLLLGFASLKPPAIADALERLAEALA